MSAFYVGIYITNGYFTALHGYAGGSTAAPAGGTLAYQLSAAKIQQYAQMGKLFAQKTKMGEPCNLLGPQQASGIRKNHYGITYKGKLF